MVENAKKTVKVFLDANVLFSASNPPSALSEFVSLLLQVASCCTSAYAYEEARRNLSVKRAAWLPRFAQLSKKIVIVKEAVLMESVGLPEKDKPILAAAIAARCSHLLTGDKRDFGHLYGKTIGGVKIVSYSMLAYELADE